MKAVFMAAGDGLRLQPLTETRPKSLLPVAGKALLHHLILEAKEAGITEAVIVIRQHKDQIIKYFQENDTGIKITFVEQGKENGTASAILAAEKEIRDTFVVLAADTVTESSVIKQVIDGHKGSITLAVKKVKNPKEYGVVELNKSGHVSIFEEKPANPKTDLANLSIYCMEPTIFNEIRSIPKSERGEYEIVNLFVGAKAVVTTGFWMDVAYPWHLFIANEFYLNKMPEKTANITGSTIEGKIIMEPGAKVIDSRIEGIAYIGSNTVIGPNATLRGTNSIGANCEIGGYSIVKNSILFDNVKAKHLTYIGDSVIGSNVNFGSGTQVANFRFDESVINVLTGKGWVNSGRRKFGAVVGDNSKFGVLSSTMPGKMVGSNCWISSGVVVNKNIPKDTKVFMKNELHLMKESGD